MNKEWWSRMVTADGVKRRALTALGLLAALPLPIACALGAYIAMRGRLAGANTQQLRVGQFLLLLVVLLVAGAGAFVVWRAATSLASGAGIEAEAAPLGAEEELDGAMMNSVSRMLTTIERQATELEQLAHQLQNANRELESRKVRLREVAGIDDVTGLHDRRFLAARLEDEVARCRRFGHPLSLVLLELEEDQGDGPSRAAEETLREAAQILLQGTRSIDVIARHDGGEFGVLLVETPLAGACAYAERIADTLSRSSWSHGRPMTASFGVSSLAHFADTSDDLVRGVEEALQAARRAGKNRIAVWAGAGIARGAEREVPA
jgi:diguanylate cyclase (GGDEF)-like protein